jgi:hypothetical protein
MFRLVLLLTAGSSGIAVVVARAYGPATSCGVLAGTAFPAPSPQRYAVANPIVFTPSLSLDRPFLIEPETGRFVSIELPERFVLEGASVLRARGEAGWLLAGGCRPHESCFGGASCEGGLVRMTFPGGRVLDRVICDALAIGPPCWYRDDPDRIIYPAANGALYQYTFTGGAGAADTRSGRTAPTRLVWTCLPGEDQVLGIRDPTQPADERFSSTIIVSLVQVRRQPGRALASYWQIWWLRLDPGGGAIVAAGRMTGPDADLSPDHDERFPSLSVQPNGLVLVYLTLSPQPTGWQLRVAPVELDPTTGAPRARMAAARILADQRMPVPPVVLADGRRIASPHRDARPADGVDRFALDGGFPAVQTPKEIVKIDGSMTAIQVPGPER